jgi:RNA polymerase sigma factor (TIGR02999 family)
MRQILVDAARRRASAKRGGSWVATTLSGKQLAAEVSADELLAIDELLGHLDERQRRVVECRFFGGMSDDEIGEALGVSARTVQREWVKARAWLHQALYAGTPLPA